MLLAPTPRHKVVSRVDVGLVFLSCAGTDNAPRMRVEMAVDAPFSEKR